jgi:hypothetical protein
MWCIGDGETLTCAWPACFNWKVFTDQRPDAVGSALLLQAGFPTVEQLGLFKLNSWPAPIWLYQVLCTIQARRHQHYSTGRLTALQSANHSSEPPGREISRATLTRRLHLLLITGRT